MTRHKDDLTVDFHAGNRAAPVLASGVKSLPAPEPKPASRKHNRKRNRKRNRTLPSDADNS